MNPADDKFWGELCSDLERAEQASAAELAEAEQLLAALGDAEVENLEPAQVESLQRAALAPAESAVTRVAVPTGVPVSGVPVGGVPVSGEADKALRLVPRRGLRHFAAAAAALLVAPKFLLAATVVTMAAAGFYLRETTKSLPFVEAVRILVDRGVDDAARSAAQGRVALDVFESLDAMRVLDGDDPNLRQHADAVRRDLLAILAREPSFALRRFDAALDELIDRMQDRSQSLEQRHEHLDALAAQLRYGISALRAVRTTLSSPLLRKNDSYCVRLETLLR